MMCLGIILIMQSYYEEKYQKLKKSRNKTKYSFIPRSEYDEAIFGLGAYDKNRVLYSENPNIGGRME